MAKKSTTLFKIVSDSNSGHYYVKQRNTKKLKKKLVFRKYDPVVRKHCLYSEKKLTY